MIPTQVVRDPAQSHYIDGLTTSQFYGLFDKNISPETLEILGKKAGEGSLDCIDLLHNIALRQDCEGRKAEDILFDLFSGKLPAKKGIDKEIQKTSQVLYQSLHHKESFNHPSKLLYIIGSAVNNQAHEIELTRKFTDIQYMQPDIIEPLPDINLWVSNRLVEGQEVNEAIKVINANNSIYPSIPLNLLNSSFYKDMLEQTQQQNLSLNKLQLLPIVSTDHWLLLGIYKKPNSNEINCFLFNSYNNLDQEKIVEFKNAVRTFFNIPTLEMTLIEANLQTNVPNGCALFIIEAARMLAKDSGQDPIALLQEFQRSFLQLPQEEQILFNQQSRRQLYSIYHDAVYSTRNN